ncbi:FYVE zinc finger family protein [Aphelenchoides avenae]|nr:FYVE zinc finger family protein [Aphelenchus avenae]
MQKKAADFFQLLQRSVCLPEISDYYEPWSLLRQDSGASFTGSLLALSVLDCNLMLDFHVLQEQEATIDIAPYVKIPTVVGQFPEQLTDDRSNVERELAAVLDQNCYLEERNRQLSDNLHQLKKKYESTDSVDNPVVDVDKSLVFTQRVRDLEREREILQARITEKEDTLRTLQQQNVDIKRINEDLYEKLRGAESRCRSLTVDLDQLKTSYKQEIEELKRSLLAAESLTKANTASEDPSAEVPSIYEELSKRTEQYMETMAILNQKQQELSRAHETIVRTEQRCKDVERQLADGREMEQV